MILFNMRVRRENLSLLHVFFCNNIFQCLLNSLEIIFNLTNYSLCIVIIFNQNLECSKIVYYIFGYI